MNSLIHCLNGGRLCGVVSNPMCWVAVTDEVRPRRCATSYEGERAASYSSLVLLEYFKRTKASMCKNDEKKFWPLSKTNIYLV